MTEHGPMRERLLTEALIGPHEVLYCTSASFKAKIDTWVRLLLATVEDAATAAVAEQVDFAERMREERERTPMFLVQGEDFRPICGNRAPSLLLGSEVPPCSLPPAHEGPHRSGITTWDEGVKP